MLEIVQIDVSNTVLLERVAKDVFDHEVTPAHLASYVAQDNHILFVALKEGVVVGQARAVIHYHPDANPELYVDNLGVTPELKRAGIATKLMDRLVKVGKQRGCTDMWLATEPDNEEAIGFYLAYGMAKTKMELFADFPAR